LENDYPYIVAISPTADLMAFAMWWEKVYVYSIDGSLMWSVNGDFLVAIGVHKLVVFSPKGEIIYSYTFTNTYDLDISIENMIAFIPAFGDYVYVFNWTYRPIPLFTYTPEMPRLGDTIVFNASLSYDPDGNITSYIWDFGDGTIAEGVIVNHTFMEPGVYNVSLTVTDIDGLSSSIVYEITVAPLPVVVNVNTDARIYIDDILYGTASPGDPLEIKIKPMTGAINVTAVPLDNT